jgi:two-component system nitrogen regulation response regulator GlnG
LNTAVTAVRHGAFEYIVKPFDLEQMKSAVARALHVDQLVKNDQLPEVQSVGELVGKTPVMQQVFRRIALCAAANANVLVNGESGTGKELAARAIHRYSARSDGPFVAVNMASLSPSLAESELFGHVRGAFTGADHSRTGLLVQADGGTLFLDEVADIPLPVQVKLLRVLEEGEVAPVGSNERVKTNFRIVSATHQQLLENVKQGSFRHDLYFRLCAFQIEIPPLRQRREDIPALADYFLNQLTAENRSARPTIAPQTIVELQRRPWYGNVRELRNTIEHALILARGGVIMPEHLSPPVQASAVPQVTGGDPQAAIRSQIGEWAETQLNQSDSIEDLYERLLRLVEPPLLEQALRDSNGQLSLAARKLGLHRTTLRKKMDQYGIDPQT